MLQLVFAVRKGPIERGRARIIADKTKKISANQLYPRHPRSINPNNDLKTALSRVIDPHGLPFFHRFAD